MVFMIKLENKFLKTLLDQGVFVLSLGLIYFLAPSFMTSNFEKKEEVREIKYENNLLLSARVDLLHQLMLISDKEEIKSPDFVIFDTPTYRSSFYSKKTETIYLNKKDVFSPSAEFTLFHEFAHYLQHKKRIKKMFVPSDEFLLLILCGFIFITSFLIKNRKIMFFLKHTAVFALIFTSFNLSKINEFYADHWAYNNMKDTSHFLTLKHTNRTYEKPNTIKWLFRTHPCSETRRDISLFEKEIGPFEILLLDYKYYTDPTFNSLALKEDK